MVMILQRVVQKLILVAIYLIVMRLISGKWTNYSELIWILVGCFIVIEESVRFFVKRFSQKR